MTATRIVTIQPTSSVTPLPTLTLIPSPTPTPLPSGLITIWMPRLIQDQIIQSGVLERFATEFPGIQLKWVAVDGQDQDDRLAAGGETPDLLYVEARKIGQLAQEGILFDLTGFARTDISLFPDYLRSIATWDGKTYGLPLTAKPILLFYRRDVFTKAKLPSDPASVRRMISSWDGLLQTCQTIKGRTGLLCFDLNQASTAGWLFEAMLGSAGLGYYQQGGDLSVNHSGQVGVLDQLNKFWRAGVTGNELEGSAPWLDHLSRVDNSVALVFGSPSLGKDLETWIAPQLSGQWGVVQMPSFDSSSGWSGAQGGVFIAISANSKNPDAAYTFAQFITANTDSQAALWQKSSLSPALTAAYGNGALETSDPYFGGEYTGKEYKEAAESIPDALIFSPAYPLVHKYVNGAIQRVFIGLAHSNTALDQAQSEIQSQLK